MLPKVVRNVFTVGSLTMLSRVLGLVREMLQSRLIGAGVEQSAFALAFAIPNIMDRAQQPLCKESWGVQAEIYSAQLAEVVDLAQAKVRLWWYPRATPWGFQNWRSNPDAKSAWLAESSDTKGVYRSSYLSCPAAVIEPVGPTSDVEGKGRVTRRT